MGGFRFRVFGGGLRFVDFVFEVVVWGVLRLFDGVVYFWGLGRGVLWVIVCLWVLLFVFGV